MVVESLTTMEPIRSHALTGLGLLARRHWQIIVVMTIFAGSAFIVPTLTNVATTDDWGYSRSVEILYHEHRLTVFPVVAATAVFQVFWGWIFATVFGMTLGVMRLSTVVMVGLG